MKQNEKKQNETKATKNKPNDKTIDISATIPGNLVLSKLAELLGNDVTLHDFRKKDSDCIVDGKKPAAD